MFRHHWFVLPSLTHLVRCFRRSRRSFNSQPRSQGLFCLENEVAVVNLKKTSWFSYNLTVFSSFRVISCVLTFSWPVTPLITSWSHAFGNWLILKTYKGSQAKYIMHRFWFISRRSDFERISKYWKIRNFWKKDFEKGSLSDVSVGSKPRFL